MSPKQLFQNSEHAKGWNDLTASKAWDHAISLAFAHMAQTSTAQDENLHHKMAGAREFSRILSGLGVPDEPMRDQKPQLKH